MRPRRFVSIGFGTLGLAITASGAGPVLIEDFDDGIMDPAWGVFNTEPQVLVVQEANGRLEFPASQNTGVEALSGYVAIAWALQLDVDFSLRVDWNFTVPSATGEAGIVIALVYGGAPEMAAPEDALTVQVGIEADVPYEGYEVFADGELVIDEFGPRLATSGTYYIGYETATDMLSIGDDPKDLDPITVGPVRGLTGACRLSGLLAGFSDGQVPAFGGDLAYFDNLVIETGNLVAPCPWDLVCDGVVSTQDFLELLGQWGPCFACSSDFNGDGFVTTADFLELLGHWGACP